MSKLQTYIGGHISVDDNVLMVETSCYKIESIELISLESSKASIEHLNQQFKPILTVNRASKSLNQVIKFWWLWRLFGAAMEAYELSKLINSIDSILLQDVSTIKTISSTEMWPPIYVCNLDKFVPLLPETLFHFPKRFSWNVRMFYRSKQLIEHINQQFKSLQAHSNR